MSQQDIDIGTSANDGTGDPLRSALDKCQDNFDEIYGGEFASKFTLPEVSTPDAPDADKAVLFVKDNGSGKSQLCVRFATGAVQVIATEP